ncbi:protein-associating with the carboxyl-terminal domain of ezrin-like isoform X2 [Clytia hemisphaerica]|uniref:protein-associating with the carboxyl-terminal domain of ezrin-like isoform X2 n=1 Tax=Clytia hemisphaerica TaxID=252671 RepID=UPI0034D3A2F9
MGAENSSLKKFQHGEVFESESDYLTIASAQDQTGDNKYTVFQYLKNSPGIEPAKKNIQVSKGIRHPYILKFVNTFEDSKHMTLVTEDAAPLSVAIEKQVKEEIMIGLYNVLQALIFLHQKIGLCHNNINVSTVYVTKRGDWKLALFEHSSKIVQTARDSYSQDAIGYGELALSILEYLNDDQKPTIKFMERLQQSYTEVNKSNLGSLKTLVNDPVFKFPYMELVQSLETITLKQNEEKLKFFRSLIKNIHGSPSLSVCRRCIPTLFTSTVLSDPTAECILDSLFASGNAETLSQSILPLIDKEYFHEYCIPCILKLFELRDKAVRLILLQRLPLYIDCIEKNILKEQILPEVLAGLQDDDDLMVSATLRALSYFVLMIGGQAVVGSQGSKLFHNRLPDFSRVTMDEGFSRSPRKEAKLKTDEETDVCEERRLKRTEREKQREEQRKRREERRKERDLNKAKKIEKQTSTVTNQEKEEKSPSKEGSETSEADWEGFIAQDDTESTGEGDKDEWEWDEKTEELPKNTLRKQSLKNTDDAFNGFKNDDEDDWQTDWNEPSVNHSNTNRDVDNSFHDNDDDDQDDWQTDWNEKNVENSDYMTKVTEIKNKSNKTSEKKEKETKTIESKTKGMSLSSKTKTKVTPKDNKDTNTTTKKTDLGDEFSIKIKQEFSSEPDYFADMIPDFNEKKTVLIESKTNITNSKFQAAPDDSEVMGGWGDDDGVEDGWTDDF